MTPGSVFSFLTLIARIVVQSNALHPKDAKKVRGVLREIDRSLEKPAKPLKEDQE